MILKIQVKYKSEKGGWRFLRCECCGQPRIFTSWILAEEWCKENGIKDFKLMRL